MTQIVLVRQNAGLTDNEKATFFGLLLKFIDGLGDLQRKRVRRFFNWLIGLEPGEMATVDVIQPRSYPFHKMHMKMEADIFAAQERVKQFDQFRLWLKVGAGFVDWMAGPKGGVVPVPKSISYAQLEEQEYREFHQHCIDFLRTDHACHYLWPHLDIVNAREMMDVLLDGFER